MRAVWTLALAAGVEGTTSKSDLVRASTKKPRVEFKGSGVGMSDVLNGHLSSNFPMAAACDDWSLEGLQTLQRELHAHRSLELESIYADVKDRRTLRTSLVEHEQEWAALREAADGCDECLKVLRDGHCHEAVMWLVHHVPQETQQAVFQSRVVPLLPRRVHRPDALGDSARARAVMNKYRGQYTCSACHMIGPTLPKDSDPLAPKWPPPLPPQFPQQFHSLVDGWEAGGQEGNFNYTGEWFYDFNNNRFRQNVNVTTGPAKGMQMIQLWLGVPTPDDEKEPAEKLYGKGAERGNLFIFITTPGAPTFCSKDPFGFSIVHPDALTWGPNFQGADVPTSTYDRREFVHGQWADHYGLYYNSTHEGCSGPFQMWRSVTEGVPIADYGVGQCGTPLTMAGTHWQHMIREEPALELFQMDFSKCKAVPPPEEVEEHIRTHAQLPSDMSMAAFVQGARAVLASRRTPPRTLPEQLLV